MVTRYQCRSCDSVDSDHQENTPPPQALVCWNCGAGSRLSIPEQVARQVGMLPVFESKEIN